MRGFETARLGADAVGRIGIRRGLHRAGCQFLPDEVPKPALDTR